MDTLAKLQIKPGQRIAVLTATAGVPAITTDDANPPAAAGESDVTVAFVSARAELATVAVPAIDETWSALRFRPA